MVDKVFSKVWCKFYHLQRSLQYVTEYWRRQETWPDLGSILPLTLQRVLSEKLMSRKLKEFLEFDEQIKSIPWTCAIYRNKYLRVKEEF